MDMYKISTDEMSAPLANYIRNILYNFSLSEDDDKLLFKGKEISSSISTYNLNLTGITATENIAMSTASTFKHGDDVIIDESGKIFRLAYNDIAEKFRKQYDDEDIQYGDILSWDKTGVVRSTSVNDVKSVGVCSDTFGFCLGGVSNEDNLSLKEFVPIGLVGRVNVKVTGKVRIGDFITTSDIAGVGIATKEIVNGSIVGKALEDHDGDSIDRISILIYRI